MDAFLDRCIEEKKRSGKGFILTIEGGIGVGKSTLLSQIGKRGGDHVRCFPEPLDEWTNYIHGYNPLAQFYSSMAAPSGGQTERKMGKEEEEPCHGPCKQAFRLQIIILLTLVKREEEIARCAESSPGPALLLVERSITSTLAFIRANETIFCSIETALIFELFRVMTKNKIPPHLSVYLKSSVATQRKRIQRRQRKEECNVDESYLTRVALETEKEALSRTPLLIICTENISPVQVEERIWEKAIFFLPPPQR